MKAHLTDAAAQDLAHRFVAQAEAEPEAVVIRSTAAECTNGQLLAKAVVYRQWLSAVGVRPGHRVLITADCQVEVIAAMVAAAAVGAAYVAVESGMGQHRLRVMVAEVTPAAVLHDASFNPGAHGLGGIACRLLDTGESVMPVAALCVYPSFPGSTPAYVVYTSGSTGRPKGVVGTQSGLLNRLDWQQRHLPLGEDDLVLQRTHLGFVDAVAEIWRSLLGPSTLVLIDHAQVADMESLLTAIAEYRVTCLTLVPSILRALLQSGLDLSGYCASLRWCYLSGEPLDQGLVDACHQALPECMLINLYGMSEAAADVTWMKLEPGGSTVSIGRAIDGVRVTVLDGQGEPCAMDDSGQIAIGGDAALALGYLGQPARTAEAFVPDPHSGRPGQRIYLTGDRGRWGHSGELEYLGRVDRQVKIYGHRVELNDIEHIAERHPGVSEAAVTSLNINDSNPQLLLALVPDAKLELSVSSMRDYLRDHFAQAVVPDYIIIVEALPRLYNGKLDRQRLTAHFIAEDNSPGELHSKTERHIALVWQEVLRRSLPSRDDSFLRVGGNSLTAGLVMVKLRKQFDVALGPADFFAAETLADLAELIDCRLEMKTLHSAAEPGEQYEIHDF